MSITAANATISLFQSTLFPTPVQIQQFATDDIADIESATILERQMGVDGVLSFGFVWVERLMEITLKADSPSVAFFDTINAQQEAVQDVYPLNGTIIVPAIGKMYNLVNGGLQTYKPMPGIKKVLQPQRYQLVWNRVIAIPTR